MNLRVVVPFAVAVFAGAGVMARGADVIINEIMYHPISEDPREEFIEVYNRDSAPVDLTGWRFSGGVQFTFPAIQLAPSQYLVVAADLAIFKTKHPGIANVVGGWQGALSNSDEDIDLDNAQGTRQDSVHYADEGDWAIRERGPVNYNHRGWVWNALHDGQGRSLELINQAVPNKYGQNWTASSVAGGTPGQRNSVAKSDTPPLILDVQHFPIIPKSTESVSVVARVIDELPTGLTVALRFRIDGQSSFERLEMIDDGKHQDGIAGDKFYGATLPPRPAHTIVEFYIEAQDGAGKTRTWPAPVLPDNSQSANLLYQVRDSTLSTSRPLYLLIMKEGERAELDYLVGTLPDALSDAQMNGTFISVDSSGTQVRYQVGIRNRGHGSRTARPNNFRVNFTSDHRWNGVTAINLNSQYTHNQLIGSALFQKAGLAAADARVVNLRVNNSDLTQSGAPQFGVYAALEVMNEDYARRHFPTDSKGNVYRGVASDAPATGEADLYYRGSTPDPYRRNYKKETNVSEDNWSDLIELTRVLSQASTENYVAEVSRVLDVNKWLRYFAMNAIVDNNETGLYNGYGDDYGLYHGASHLRFELLPYDNDTIMGQGAEKGRTDASIFRAANLSILERFLKGPEFLPLYQGHLRGLMATLFSAEQLNPMLDATLGSFVPATTINQMKAFAAARNTYINSILPPLVPINASWKYYNGSGAPDDAWIDHSFDDSSWVSGQALLYIEPSALPATKKTKLPAGRSTYYFRTRFMLHPTLTRDLLQAKVRLNTIIDDGAIIYLNGQEILRLGMPSEGSDYDTFANRVVDNAVYEGPFVAPGYALRPGENVLAVEVHQSDAGSSDVAFGLTLDLQIEPQSEPFMPLLISEVLANNTALLAPPNATLPDWVELYNQTDSPIDLGNMSITDNASLPRKWIFPAAAQIAPRGFYIVRLDANLPAGPDNTGFGLNKNGDGVFLFESPDRGGALIDSIEFGTQAANFSIGRIPTTSTNWVLNVPSPGALNTPAQLGDPARLKINEWMADPSVGDDWFEIFNPESKPVALTGLYLSDNLNTRTEFPVAPLSFIGIGSDGFQRFEADSETAKGAAHSSFKLSATGEALVIFDPSGAVIDSITFAAQQTDVSEGRFPDGSANIIRFPGCSSPGRRNLLMPKMAIVAHDRSAVVQFLGTAGVSYSIQYCDSVGSAWTKLKDLHPTENGPVEVTDPIPNSSRRFYRVVSPALP